MELHPFEILLTTTLFILDPINILLINQCKPRLRFVYKKIQGYIAHFLSLLSPLGKLNTFSM